MAGLRDEDRGPRTRPPTYTIDRGRRGVPPMLRRAAIHHKIDPGFRPRVDQPAPTGRLGPVGAFSSALPRETGPPLDNIRPAHANTPRAGTPATEGEMADANA